MCLWTGSAPVVRIVDRTHLQVGEVLALWREEFPKGMSKEDYARKRSGWVVIIYV